jgi:hypothetical protein
VSLPDGDGLPWYRHAWPWFIVGLLGLSMTASLATVVLAYRGRDALVRDDWYKDGVAINRSLERLEAARRRDIHATLSFEPADGRVVVRLSGEGTASLDALALVLSHATRAELDRRVRLARGPSGAFEGRLEPLRIGRFHASVEPVGPDGGDVAAADAWRLARPFYFAGATATVALDPGR